MRSFLVLTCLLFIINAKTSAQGCFPDDDDPTIQLNCTQNCTDLLFTIPDLRETSSYRVVDIPYNPLEYNDGRAIDVTFSGAWPGNSYTQAFPLPFDFCFYGATYDTFAIGANGTVSFDPAIGNGFCDPFLKRGPATFPLPNARYARAMIAGVMHDLDPGDTARTSPTRKIQYRVLGTAPCRKLVVNFYQVPLWPGPQRNCQTSLNTHQIIIYESTGMIDIFIKDSPQCQGSNEGYNTVGIQNYNRDQSLSPRDRNCRQWGGNDLNLGFRFIPSGGNSLLQSTALIYRGREIATGNVRPGANPGELDVSFTNVCPTLPANTYVLRATYADCTGLGTIDLFDTIYVNKNNSLTATATPRPAQCTSPTGSILVDVPRGLGIPPFTYSLNGGPPQLSNVFTNLAAGTYTITVADATICSDVLTVVVGTTTTLNVTLTSTNTTCNNASNGRIEADPGGGIAPVRYSLDGGPSQLSPIFTNLAPGTYEITVTDAAGCVSNGNMATIDAGPPLSTTVTKSDISCFGNGDGSVIVTPPAAGTAPFAYSLDGITFQASNSFTGLVSGDYTVRFRDANGCTGNATFSIVEPGRLSATATASTTRCFGESNGQISVFPSGGAAPYSYSLDNITFQPSGLFTVAAGVYTIYIEDGRGCNATTTATVTEPNRLTAIGVTNNATCNGNDGTITITAGGGSNTFRYSLDGTTFQPSNTFMVAPGTYTVTVRDGNDCEIIVPNLVVQLTNTLTLTPGADESICEGRSVQLQANTNATQFAWSPATGLDNTSIANPTASPVVTTEYILTASIGACVAEDRITVNVNAAPIPNAGADGDICVGQTYRLQGTGGVTYQWTPSTYLDATNVSNPLVTPDVTTEYTLQVVDAQGCRSLQSDRVSVMVTPPYSVTVTPGDTILHTGDQVQLVATSIGTSYTWTPATGLNNPSIANPVLTAGNAGDDILYRVVATNSGGCRGEGTIRIQVYKGPDLYVPSAFTPNGDGKNDRFFPFPVGIKELKYFRVFDRWGQMIFSTSSLGHAWDGTYGGKPVNTAVYIWTLQALTKDNETITKQGTVTVIR